MLSYLSVLSYWLLTVFGHSEVYSMCVC